MMVRSIVAAIALVAAAPVPTPQVSIAAAMNASAAGWNAGDLDRFMAVYATDAMFVTTKGVLRSKAEIAAHYRSSFAGAANTRGRLTFQTLAFRQLSPVHQLMIARWTLTPRDTSAKVETGLTTLVFERRPEGWRIISDHSS